MRHHIEFCGWILRGGVVLPMHTFAKTTGSSTHDDQNKGSIGHIEVVTR